MSEPDDIERYADEYEESMVEEYISSTKTKLLFIFVLLAVCIVCAIYSMSVNGRDMDIPRMLEVLIGHLSGNTYDIHTKDWFDDNIVWNSALPRMIFTVIAGIGLAVAGTAMQSTMNNPLADPYTVGVSAGACLGLSVAIVLGFTLNVDGAFPMMIFAFMFALIPLMAIVLLAPRTRSSPSMLILAGVAVAYLFNSLDTTLMVTVDNETLAVIYSWQTGTLSGIRWDNILPTLIFIFSASVVVSYLSRQLNLLALGDASATSLGIDPDNLRIICLTAIAFIVAAVVGNAGVVGFVGLVAPHMVRFVVGSDNRYVLPAAALASIIMMLVADTLCRTFSAVDDIPVGAVLGLIGAPIFLYLIIRRKSRVW